MATHAIDANELPLSNKLSNSCRFQLSVFVTRQNSNYAQRETLRKESAECRLVPSGILPANC